MNKVADLLRGPINIAFALLNTYMLDPKVAQPGSARKKRKRKRKQSQGWQRGRTGLSIAGLSEIDHQSRMATRICACEHVMVCVWKKCKKIELSLITGFQCMNYD
jgi:hypothetical protein